MDRLALEAGKLGQEATGPDPIALPEAPPRNMPKRRQKSRSMNRTQWRYLIAEATLSTNKETNSGTMPRWPQRSTSTRQCLVLAPRSAKERFRDWARTQNRSRQCALKALGERESGTARLEEAVAAYREALQERTRARVPLDWAMTQINLGNVLSDAWRAGAAGRRGSKRPSPPIAKR